MMFHGAERGGKRPRISEKELAECEETSNEKSTVTKSRSPSLTPSSEIPTSPSPPNNDSHYSADDPRMMSHTEEDSTDSEAAPENLSLKKNCSPLSNDLSVSTASTMDSSFAAYFNAQQLPISQYHQRSPVDILRRVFPLKRRIEIEMELQRCKGDVLQAIDAMMSSESEENFQSSAFSPLALACSSFHRNFNPHPNRRFLTAPYAGTGYLPTVIRPPLSYPQNTLLHQMTTSTLVGDLYSSSACVSEKPVTTSPGSASGSEKTTYSE